MCARHHSTRLYPEGTHIICADVLMFHMDMARTPDGHLKVLHVRIMMD